MVTSFLAILYEDLLIGEQVDVQTTVNEGLLKGEQADVYTEMVTTFLAILYEDLLIGEQVDVQTTVNEGLLKGEQADVYTYRSSISCGSNSLNVAALQKLPACSSDVFGTSTRRRCRNFSRMRKARRRTRKEGKVARSEAKREISCTCIDESSFLPCAYR